MSKRLVSFLLILVLVWPAPMDARRRWVPAIAAPSGGGSPAWFDSVLAASTASSSPVAHESQYGVLGAPVTVTAGNATKLRVYFEFQNIPGQTCKISLFTTAGVLLASGSAVATGATNAYIEATITSTALSAGTYIVAYMVQSGSFGNGRFLTGASGVGKVNFSETYSTFPSGNLTFGDSTSQEAVSIYVEP